MSNRPITLFKTIICAALLAGFVISVSPSLSLAAMSQAQVRAAVEKDYDVKVIKITAGVASNRPVFYVKIMYKGGNFNTAFQVNTIVIDAKTGKRVSQFRHKSSGRSLPGTYDNVPNRQTTDALRGTIRR